MFNTQIHCSAPLSAQCRCQGLAEEKMMADDDS